MFNKIYKVLKIKSTAITDQSRTLIDLYSFLQDVSI